MGTHPIFESDFDCLTELCDMFLSRYIALCAVTLNSAQSIDATGAGGGVTVEKGEPAVLTCIDAQLRENIAADSSGEKVKKKEIQIELLKDKRLDGSSSVARTIFEFRLNQNGFIAGGSEWTDEQTYQNGKFSALENGVAISHTSLDDDGAYTCRVKVQRSPLTFDRRFNVTVHVPPITNPPQANILVDTGSYASFEEVAYCNALNGKPHAQVEWLIPPQIDLADIRKETEILVDNYKTLKTKSVLRLVPRKHYNGLAARCQIRHPTLDQPVYYNVNISVEYRPSEPKITPYFKSDLLSCEATGNPAPRIDWVWFPSSFPAQRHQLNNNVKLELPLDSGEYNFTCVASNQHGTTETMTSSRQLAKRQKFLEANLNIIVGAGIGTLVALLLIGFCVCYCTLRNNKNQYKSEIKFPAESVQLHCPAPPHEHHLGRFRPSPPQTRPPLDHGESDNDSFIGDDVDLADDPFVRSHSILQSSQQQHHHNSSFDQAMSDVYPAHRYPAYHPAYDYQPEEVTYSSQNTHRFKDIPGAFTYQNGNPHHPSTFCRREDILHQSDSPIDARQLSQSAYSSSNHHSPPPTYHQRDEGELQLRDLPPFAPPPPPRQEQQHINTYAEYQ